MYVHSSSVILCTLTSSFRYIVKLNFLYTYVSITINNFQSLGIQLVSYTKGATKICQRARAKTIQSTIPLVQSTVYTLPPMPPGFDRYESFGNDELTAKHCYFRCARPPDADGIKIFD